MSDKKTSLRGHGPAGAHKAKIQPSNPALKIALQPHMEQDGSVSAFCVLRLHALKGDLTPDAMENGKLRKEFRFRLIMDQGRPSFRFEDAELDTIVDSIQRPVQQVLVVATPDFQQSELIVRFSTRSPLNWTGRDLSRELFDFSLYLIMGRQEIRLGLDAEQTIDHGVSALDDLYIDLREDTLHPDNPEFEMFDDEPEEPSFTISIEEGTLEWSINMALKELDQGEEDLAENTYDVEIPDGENENT